MYELIIIIERVNAKLRNNAIVIAIVIKGKTVNKNRGAILILGATLSSHALLKKKFFHTIFTGLKRLIYIIHRLKRLIYIIHGLKWLIYNTWFEAVNIYNTWFEAVNVYNTWFEAVNIYYTWFEVVNIYNTWFVVVNIYNTWVNFCFSEKKVYSVNEILEGKFTI